MTQTVSRPVGAQKHLPRLLRGGAGVQVDKRAAAAHGPGQDREVSPYRGDVERDSGRPAGRTGPLPGASQVIGSRHMDAPACTNSSYPLVSSSSASSGPPSLTIRPPTNTCTKSGWMYRRIRV